MITAAVAFVSALAAGAVLTPLVRALAHRYKAFDHALSSRKVHGRPVPRLGGIAIVLAFYGPLLALLFVNSDVGRRFYENRSLAVGLFVGGALIAALGVYDDLRGSSARTKLVVQFAVAALMYAFGFRIDAVANPFGAPVELGALGLPFTMLWIAGVVNAMNLIDGLDGLAGGVAFVAIATIFGVAVLHGQPLMALFAAALGGAVAGFLFYNFNPASIFMGDTGSMFLGFVFATTSIQTSHKSSAAAAILVPIVALGVPLGDTLLAMARRAVRGAPLFSADRGHIHHRLVAMGLSQRQAVLAIYAVSAVLGGASLVLTFASSAEAAVLLTALSLVGLVTLRVLGYMDLRSTERILAQRRRNARMQAAVRGVARHLKAAASTDEIWVAVRAVAADLGATAVGLRSTAIGAIGHREPGNPAASVHTTSYSLPPGRPSSERLELAWVDRDTVDRDTEIAVEHLCELLADALQRVHGQSRSAAGRRAVNE